MDDEQVSMEILDTAGQVRHFNISNVKKNCSVLYIYDKRYTFRCKIDNR